MYTDSEMTACQLIWHSAGCPRPPKKTTTGGGQCYICGHQCDEEHVSTKLICGPNYTNHASARIPWSPCVCVPCAWVMSGRPPDTLRMWSVVYRDDGRVYPSDPKAPEIDNTHLASRSETMGLLDTLLSPPDKGKWFVAITTSGKIHTLPFTPVNNGQDTWSVRFERETITSSITEIAHVIRHTTELLSVGYSRGEVERLDPHPAKVAKHGISHWKKHAGFLRPYVTSNLLRLVTFLSRKETYDNCKFRTSELLR